jgi:dTDP-4-dehydrorhamnose reductase
MEINKIIIFGANGMLGNYLSRYYSDRDNIKLIKIYRNDFEINVYNLSFLEDFLCNIHIDKHSCIINCIGIIPQRETNIDSKNYYIINSIFPQHLSKLCNKYNTRLIYPTTDCVFSGEKGNYNELDFHDENNIYGISKSLGELGNATVIRTSIIGEEKENKKSFLEFVKNSKGEINGWINHYWNGITCYEYCKIIDKIITENLFWEGVRHLYSPERKSKYELSCIIKNVYNLDIIIHKYKASENIDKTLSSIYDINNIFKIKSLEEQIYEQSIFKLQ